MSPGIAGQRAGAGRFRQVSASLSSGLSSGLASGVVSGLAAASLLSVVLGTSGCAGASQGAAQRGRDAVVLITCNVAEASLFVDGRFIAPVGLLRGGVAVSPGSHRVELRHQEYLSRFLELELQPAERRTIAAELFPILP
ncbi:MAG: hypothetical protein IPI49_02160 [Myxococcales bacterium]|nr:hypothetical protein [Myxococcales bacterium]